MPLTRDKQRPGSFGTHPGHPAPCAGLRLDNQANACSGHIAASSTLPLGRALAPTVRAARDVCPTRLPADAAAPNLSGSGSAKSPLLRRSRPATARLASGGQETRLHQQVIAQCEEFDTCHLSSTMGV